MGLQTRASGCVYVSVSGAVSVVSRCAGFRWSIEMISVRLFILMVKCLSVWLMMGYGPS